MQLWSFAGSEQRAAAWADEYRLSSTILVDVDQSLRSAYFVPNGQDAYAANPRHYVIDADGNLAYVSTTPNPGDLHAVLEDLLDAGSD